MHRIRMGAVVLFTAASIGVADSVTLTADRDNTLYETGPTEEEQSSNGGGSYFFAAKTGSNAGETLRRGLVRFDLSAIPANAVVSSATLTLRCSKSVSGGVPIDLHRVLADWGEGTSDAGVNEGAGGLPTANDATWNFRFFGALTAWTNPGGDFSATVSATQSVAGVAVYDWTSAQLATDVQGWITTASTNFGWLVKGAPVGGEDTAQTAKRFDSRNNTTAANRPKLTVVYTVPSPTIACCFANGSCTDLSTTDCANGGGFNGGSSCSPSPCLIACCFGDGSCTDVLTADCTGTPSAYPSSCSPNPCPQTLGVCCYGATCRTGFTAAQCNEAALDPGGVERAGSQFLVGVAVCNLVGPPSDAGPKNFKTPCCKSDYNKSGVKTVQDLFDYLADYFAKKIGADTNGAPPAAGAGVSVQDLFDYLAAYFAGGCP